MPKMAFILQKKIIKKYFVVTNKLTGCGSAAPLQTGASPRPPSGVRTLMRIQKMENGKKYVKPTGEEWGREGLIFIF